jgi:hypothetical protein
VQENNKKNFEMKIIKYRELEAYKIIGKTVEAKARGQLLSFYLHHHSGSPKVIGCHCYRERERERERGRETWRKLMVI